MRINDDQRREVAKKMREYNVAEFKESAIIPFLECLGHGYTDWQGILDELADLIEPQERTCRRLREFVVYRDGSTGEYRVACSACGFSADPQEWAETYNFCPRCGAKVVS